MSWWARHMAYRMRSMLRDATALRLLGGKGGESDPIRIRDVLVNRVVSEPAVIREA